MMMTKTKSVATSKPNNNNNTSSSNNNNTNNSNMSSVTIVPSANNNGATNSGNSGNNNASNNNSVAKTNNKTKRGTAPARENSTMSLAEKYEKYGGIKRNDFQTLVEHTVDACCNIDAVKDPLDDVCEILLKVRSQYDAIHCEVGQAKRGSRIYTGKHLELFEIRKQAQLLDIQFEHLALREKEMEKREAAAVNESVMQRSDSQDSDMFGSTLHQQIQDRISHTMTNQKVYRHMYVRLKKELAILNQKVSRMEKFLNRKRAETAKLELEARSMVQVKASVAQENQLMRLENQREQGLKRSAVRALYDTLGAKKNSIKKRSDFERWRHECALDAANENFQKKAGRLRKMWAMEKLVGHYLQKLVIAVVEKSQSVENGFQTMKSLTGLTDVMDIVHKLMDRDVDYQGLTNAINQAEMQKKVLEMEYERIRKQKESMITEEPTHDSGASRELKNLVVITNKSSSSNSAQHTRGDSEEARGSASNNSNLDNNNSNNSSNVDNSNFPTADRNTNESEQAATKPVVHLPEIATTLQPEGNNTDKIHDTGDQSFDPLLMSKANSVKEREISRDDSCLTSGQTTKLALANSIGGIGGDSNASSNLDATLKTNSNNQLMATTNSIKNKFHASRPSLLPTATSSNTGNTGKMLHPSNSNGPQQISCSVNIANMTNAADGNNSSSSKMSNANCLPTLLATNAEDTMNSNSSTVFKESHNSNVVNSAESNNNNSPRDNNGLEDNSNNASGNNKNFSNKNNESSNSEQQQLQPGNSNYANINKNRKILQINTSNNTCILQINNNGNTSNFESSSKQLCYSSRNRSRELYNKQLSFEETLGLLRKENEQLVKKSTKLLQTIEHLKDFIIKITSSKDANALTKTSFQMSDFANQSGQVELLKCYRVLPTIIEQFLRNIFTDASDPRGRIHPKATSKFQRAEQNIYKDQDRLLEDKDFLRRNCRVPPGSLSNSHYNTAYGNAHDSYGSDSYGNSRYGNSSSNKDNYGNDIYGNSNDDHGYNNMANDGYNSGNIANKIDDNTGLPSNIAANSLFMDNGISTSSGANNNSSVGNSGQFGSSASSTGQVGNRNETLGKNNWQNILSNESYGDYNDIKYDRILLKKAGRNIIDRNVADESRRGGGGSNRRAGQSPSHKSSHIQEYYSDDPFQTTCDPFGLDTANASSAIKKTKTISNKKNTNAISSPTQKNNSVVLVNNINSSSPSNVANSTKLGSISGNLHSGNSSPVNKGSAQLMTANNSNMGAASIGSSANIGSSKAGNHATFAADDGLES